MRFLFPLIIIGALLATQVWAQESPSALPLPAGVASSQSSSVRLCKTKAAERRAKRLLKRGRAPQCQIAQKGSSSSSHSSVSSSSSLFSSSSTSSAVAGTYDSLSDTTVRSQFLLLGETGPVVGAAKVFLEEEPLDITSIAVNLTTEAQSVDSFLVYDETRRFLGRALLDPSASTNRKYVLTLASGTATVERRQDYSFYMRPVLRKYDEGGLGNQIVEIGNFVFEGYGVWSSQKYTKGSSENFPAFLTARSMVTQVRNALKATDLLVAGPQRTLASFTFDGTKSDPMAHIDVLTLQFQIGETGGVQLSNIFLRVDGSDERQTCNATASIITCAIPVTSASLADGPRTITISGDVFVPAVQDASLFLSLNNPGDILTAGSVEWSDGTSTFDWIAVASSVAQGTVWKY